VKTYILTQNTSFPYEGMSIRMLCAHEEDGWEAAKTCAEKVRANWPRPDELLHDHLLWDGFTTEVFAGRMLPAKGDMPEEWRPANWFEIVEIEDHTQSS